MGPCEHDDRLPLSTLPDLLLHHPVPGLSDSGQEFELGTLGIPPDLFAIPSEWLGGYVSDSLYRSGWSLTWAGKTCLVGGLLMSSVITLSALAQNAYAALACFAIAYGGLAFAGAVIWSLSGDVVPTPGHVASIGGIQHFASNLAGILTTTFTGIMPRTRGSEGCISPTNVMLPDLLPTIARRCRFPLCYPRSSLSVSIGKPTARSDNFFARTQE
jgi:hypothetical protein